MRSVRYRIVSKYRKHKKHSPTRAQSVASLRSSLSYAALVAFADAQAARARIPFFTLPRGSTASPFHPGLLSIAPHRGSEFRSPSVRNHPAKLRFICAIATQVCSPVGCMTFAFGLGVGACWRRLKKSSMITLGPTTKPMMVLPRTAQGKSTATKVATASG